MGLYYRVHVFHTAVANFDVVFFEDFVKFVSGWEMSLYQVDEQPYFCFDVFTVRGVEPNYFSSPVSFPFWFCFCFTFVILYFGVLAAFLQGFVVHWCSLSECAII